MHVYLVTGVLVVLLGLIAILISVGGNRIREDDAGRKRLYPQRFKTVDEVRRAYKWDHEYEDYNEEDL